MDSKTSAPRPVPARLGLVDVVSIIVGIIVGVGIFETPAKVFHNASGPADVLLVWILVAIPALLGALCYAELASTYPRSGGEYVYLTRAYSPSVGFFFAWAQLVIIRPAGGIGILAAILATKSQALWGLEKWSAILLAALAIALLTLINVLGVNPGKRTQNLLTLTKMVCLGGIILAGFFWARPPSGPLPDVDAAPSIALMLMAVVYSFDGWNEAAYVAHEVRDARRNLPRALIVGTAAVTLIYLLVNLAYLVGLGFDGARALGPNPADLLAQTFGDTAGQVINVLIIISVLGAINGMIFTGARIFSELGTDHRIFAPLGWWSRRWQTPIWSLLVQALLSIGMVVGVGLLWEKEDGFDALLRCSAPVFYLFFLLTGVALIVLRFRDRGVDRPFRVPLYPLTPLLFCGWSGFMLCISLGDARAEALVGVAILLAGVPFYLLSRWLRPTHAAALPGPHCLGKQWVKELQGTGTTPPPGGGLG